MLRAYSYMYMYLIRHGWFIENCKVLQRVYYYSWASQSSTPVLGLLRLAMWQLVSEIYDCMKKIFRPLGRHACGERL